MSEPKIVFGDEPTGSVRWEIADECRFSKFSEEDSEQRVGEITKKMRNIQAAGFVP